MTADIGEISVDFELENPVDREMFERGSGDESGVRRTRVRGIVDTGAVMLVLPQNIVERLGLRVQETVVVTYADNRREERPVAGPVTVRIGDRSTRADCVVGPPSSEVLIGQIILEALDLIADCTNRTLTPREPDYPLLNLRLSISGPRRLEWPDPDLKRGALTQSVVRGQSAWSSSGRRRAGTSRPAGQETDSRRTAT